MKRIFLAIAILALLANFAVAKEMDEREVAEALAKVPALVDLKIVRADNYDGSWYIILDYGNNTGVKISRFEIKDLEKYLAPKERKLSEPEPKVIEKIIEVPGPERIVEKKVEVPVKVPGPTRFIVREALPTVLVAGLFFISGRIAEDRYEHSLVPEISKQIQPGHATVSIRYRGNPWLQRASDAAYTAGGITLSIPVLRRIF